MKRTVYETLIGLAFLSIIGTIGYYLFQFFINYNFNITYFAFIIAGLSLLIGSRLIGRSIIKLRTRNENN